jgi:hypothetical protein
MSKLTKLKELLKEKEDIEKQIIQNNKDDSIYSIDDGDLLEINLKEINKQIRKLEKRNNNETRND